MAVPEEEHLSPPTAPVKQHIIYKPLDRPDVEVLVDDQWLPGELRAWRQYDDDTWSAEVQYRPPGEHSSTIATFPAADVRPDTVDRSHGRRAVESPSTDPA